MTVLDVVAPEEAWRLRGLIDGEDSAHNRTIAGDKLFTYRWQAVEDLTLYDLEDMGPVDAVVHMAAVADVAAGHASPRRTVAANVGATVHLLELCRHEPVRPERLLLAGTAHELEAAGDVTLTEDSPIQPGTPYGFSKSVQELAVRTWGHAYAVPWVVMRNGIVAGRGMRRQIAPYLWCRRILQGMPTRLDDASQTRDLTDARDTAEAWLRALTAPLADVRGQVLQVSRGIETPVGDLLEMCYVACEGILGRGVPRRIEQGEPRPGEAGMRERFDCSKTRAILQWVPQYSPQQTIYDVAQWAAEELGLLPARAAARS